MKILNILTLALATSAVITSCHNGDNEFPDFEYQSVYFANQSVGRTVELGREPQLDNALDNQHMVQIKAVMGGAYKNTQNRVINISVDPSLCDGLYLSAEYGGRKAVPMPSNYYEIESGAITIPSGSMDGGVNVKLTDTFFNDPLALDFNYVLPVVMESAIGVDTILQGKPAVENPNRVKTSDWSVQPKDYVLYFMRYVNPWHAIYLRSGKDLLTVNGATTEIVRRASDVSKDEEVSVETSAYKECTVNLSTRTDADHVYSYTLKLTFAEDGTCTVGSADPSLTISGTGRFVVDGEKKVINNEDRDALYLQYTVTSSAGWSLSTDDTLVLRNRGVSSVFPAVEVRN